MKITVEELEVYLQSLYAGRVNDQSLFMKLVEEIGETAEVLNKLSGRKQADEADLKAQLGNELADMLHYIMAIAAVNDLDMNEIVLEKDKQASLKYGRINNMAQFVLKKREAEK